MLDGSRMNHRLAIMVNVPKFNEAAALGTNGTNWSLRRCYRAVLRAAHNLPAVGSDPINWLYQPKTIALPLVGSGPLGYGFDNAAEQALSAIRAWYNSVANGPARRGGVRSILLLVPTDRKYRPDLIERAWRRALE